MAPTQSVMTSGAIIRVVCDDGPCEGLQYVDADTGRILFNDSPEAASCIYLIDKQPGYTHSSLPHAHLDHFIDEVDA